ncbi:MAG: hypothetical protein HY870_15605, partial [Chloroflexi bacterium]|nr:hypothetical protein [Chloroflexota bacterium]
MSTATTLDELLERACPSIQYRLRVEVLGESRTAPHVPDLQRQILNDVAVQTVFGWQQPDGWLAWNFHGDKSTESGIRLLCEKGVDPCQPILANALHALERDTHRLERGIGKVGRILDERGLGGSQTIRATVLAYAGVEDKVFVQDQIDRALAAFKAVLTIDTLDDLLETYTGKLVYRPGRVWPCLYHLRLLAFTHEWRTAENHRMLAESIQRLIEWSPLPDVHVRHKSQLIAPALFCMDDFKPDLSTLDDAHWMRWFHRMELLSRLGVVHTLPALAKQIDVLREMLAAGQGRFTTTLAHPY